MSVANLRPLEIDEPVLPDGWALSRLSEVCRINPPKASLDSLEPDQPVTFVPMPAVDADKGAITASHERPFSDVKRGFTSFQDDDVIMAKITPCMENGKAAIASGLINGLGFGSTEFHVLRSNGAVLPGFIYHFVRQVSFRRAAESEMTGSVGQKRVPTGFLEQSVLPLPPLSEQRRIVEKVGLLLDRASAAQDRLAHVPAILKRFRRAVLAAACSGHLTTGWRGQHPNTVPVSVVLDGLRNSAGPIQTRRGIPVDVERSDDLAGLDLPVTWSLQSMASLLRLGALLDLKDGNHGSNHPKSGEFSETGMPFITAAQVKGYKIDYEGAPKVTGKPLKRLRVGFAKPNDAILTHKGTVGRAALNTSACVLTPQTTYYRCNAEILDARYLVYFFTSPQFYAQLAAVMSQTTRDFVPISEQYRLFAFLPPLDEQREIARRVDSLFSLAGAIEKCVAVATTRAEKLTQAVLAKAFRGELVPTEAELARSEGRAYESASDLLARIQSERSGLIDRAGARRRDRKRQRKRQMA